MELHPFLEPGQRLTPDLWYVLSQDSDPGGDDTPSQRVGHTMTYVPRPRLPPNEDGDYEYTGGDVYLLGGANPDGAFNDVFKLNLSDFTWSNLTGKNESKMDARYEHSSFRCNEYDFGAIYVYGGAHRGSSHGNVQRLDVNTMVWTTLDSTGAPCPRTYHSEQCMTSDGRFVVYSGGHKGADPIGDRQVHQFDIKTHLWSVLNTRGESPKPRHGHCVVASGNRIYVHGGMSGNTFYGDLFYLDLNEVKWTEVKHKRNQIVPCPRSAHSGVALDSCLIICGGMSRDSALDDLYSLNTETHQWTCIKVEGPSPASRLDMSMCVVELPVYANSQGAVPANQDNDDIVVLGRQAKDCLDAELSRFSSAGSSRSVASSHSSTASFHNGENTIDLPIVPSVRQRNSRRSSLSSVDESVITDATGTEGARPHVIGRQMALLLMGGMDTLGEMFNDCMIIALTGHE